MRGYKVYFDGEKFAVELELSKVVRTPYDSPVCWCAGPEIAFIEARDQNRMIQNGELEVRACKDCGEYFILSLSEASWFVAHDMALPKRCMACRKERKNGKRRS